MAASPIVLTKRTGASATSEASSPRRAATAPSSSGGMLSPKRVKPTRSAKATVMSSLPASSPFETASRSTIARRSSSRCWMAKTWASVGGRCGAISLATSV